MDNEFDLAVVGMACRFPGARTPGEFRDNLARGVDSISRFSDAEMLEAGVAPETLGRSDYVKAGPVIDGPDRFDPDFFGYSRGEAAAMDPQHRLLLELAHAALEDAGCDPQRFRGRVGLFAGAAINTYFMQAGLGRRFSENYLPTLVASDKDFLATRISYKLGLRGPSFTVQSACSTALVAVHLARQSLLGEESDLALAGAVAVRVPHRAGYFYDGSGVVSPDGRVRAFDAGANGTVFGSGAGVVALKRLADALADGDRIHAVIKGSAVNNDGDAKAGYTAPSVDGLSDVIVEALANAGLSAEDISCVEAHGSGTPLGDPIELRALTKAFRHFTPRSGFCALGSVKTNVGHLDVAAGMAGLFKSILSLRERRYFPTLHYQRPNPAVDLAATPFFVPTATMEWPEGEGPRRAGVTATGMGGTNAHVILEEAPAPTAAAVDAAEPELILLSAKTPGALDAMTRDLADAMASETAPGFLADAARTLQSGRRQFAQRRFTVASSAQEAAGRLRGAAGPAVLTGAAPDEAAPALFLLPGVGDQYAGMGRGLYRRFEVFKREIDRCAAVLQPLLGQDIRALLFPDDASEPDASRPRGIDLKRMLGRADGETPARQPLDETLYNQPALFAVEFALARLWMEAGLQPAQLAGHSLGEYVAACLAGVFSLEDALRLIAARARLVNELPKSPMLAVTLGESEIVPLLGPDLSLALINGPSLCVVAGASDAIESFQIRLQSRGAVFRPVRNGHAFHSRMLEPIVPAFEALARQIRYSPPKIPFISNVTGTWATAEQATDPLYWVRHACQTARFGDALAALWRLPERLWIEVGPGRTLGVLATQHPARPASRLPVIVPSLRHGYENQPDAEFLLQSAGRLWLAGAHLAWDKLGRRAGRRVASLPTYPFERLRCWLEPANHPESGGARDWLKVPVWKRAPAPETKAPSGAWLVMGDATPLTAAVVLHLTGQGRQAAAAADEAEALERIRLFASEGVAELNLVYFSASEAREAFHRLLRFARQLGERAAKLTVRLGVVTVGVHEVTGEESLDPDMATAAGLAGVIAREYPQVCAFTVDLAAMPDGRQVGDVAARLLAEFGRTHGGSPVALRGRARWLRTFEPLELAGEKQPDGSPLRPRGVYVITGGTRGIGWAMAKHLAQTCQARLILIGRSGDAESAERLQREIAAAGGEAEVRRCDVTDREGMARILAEAVARHGAIHGAIHAAGVLQDGMIALKDETAADQVLAPKVAGTRILFELLRPLQCDWLVLFSSISSLVPIHGQGDYCAANCYLDAFAAYANARSSLRVVAINWPAWRETGILSRQKARAGMEARHEAALRRAISTADGLKAFRRAIESPAQQILVSAASLAELAAEAEQPMAEVPATQAPAGTEPAAADAPRSEMEAAVAGIWAEVLGLPAVGIHVNFLALGGHSLLAMRIVSRLRATYEVDFTLRAFFEGPTIAQVAAAVEEAILAEVGSLSEAEAAQRVS